MRTKKGRITRPTERLRLLRRLHALGINVGVSLRPWIPGVTDLQSFLDGVPHDIRISIDRLLILKSNRKFKVGGQVLTQAEIDVLYLEEREKYRCNPRLSWDYDPTFCQRTEDDEHPVALIARRTKIHEDGFQVNGKLLTL